MKYVHVLKVAHMYELCKELITNICNVISLCILGLERKARRGNESKISR